MTSGLLVLDSTRKGRGEGETETLELQRRLSGVEAAASEKARTALSGAGALLSSDRLRPVLPPSGR